MAPPKEIDPREQMLEAIRSEPKLKPTPGRIGKQFTLCYQFHCIKVHRFDSNGILACSWLWSRFWHIYSWLWSGFWHIYSWLWSGFWHLFVVVIRILTSIRGCDQDSDISIHGCDQDSDISIHDCDQDSDISIHGEGFNLKVLNGTPLFKIPHTHLARKGIYHYKYKWVILRTTWTFQQTFDFLIESFLMWLLFNLNSGAITIMKLVIIKIG